MLTDDEVDAILRPIYVEMGLVSDAELFCFWYNSARSNIAFLRGLPGDSARALGPMLTQFGNISLKRNRPALTHAGNVICLKMSHLLRLLYDGSLTFEVVWVRLVEFARLACGGCCDPAIQRRVLPALMYNIPPPIPAPRPKPASQQGGPNENYDDLLRELQRPASPAPPPIPAKPAPQQPPPLPKHPPPDLAYESLLEDLDREDAMMNRRNAMRNARRNARRRNRARRVGIEPPAYVNAVALPGGPSESSLSTPPPPYA